MSAAFDIQGVALRSDALISLRQIALHTRAEPTLTALPGGFATRRKGHGQEVADVREYISGDDMRHLDRGTTARTGTLHIRQFQEERDRISLLVADFRPAMLWGITRAFRSVAAAEALALIGWKNVHEGGRVGLLALTASGPVFVPPRGRTRGMLDVIGGMRAAHQQALEEAIGGAVDMPLDGALVGVERLVPAGAEVIIASGFDLPGQGLGDRLARLARRRVPHLLMVMDAEAGRLPQGRYPIKLPDGRQVHVDLRGADPRPEEEVQIAGRAALLINAGASVQDTARGLAAAFPSGRGT